MKSAVVRIILYSLLILLLSSILINLLMVGNWWNFSWRNINIGFGFDDYYADSSYKSGNAEISDNIDKLQIYWIDGSVSIEAYDGNEIILSENSDENLDDDECLAYKLNDSKLTIKYSCEKVKFWHFGDNDNNKNLSVKIPQSMYDDIDDLDIDVISADIIADKAIADTIDINTVSGNINASDIECDTLDLETLSGEIDVSGSFTKGDFETLSGDVIIDMKKQADKLDVESLSGSIILTVLPDFGFTLEFDSLSGEMDCELVAEMKSNKIIVGSGTSKYTFDTLSGDMYIKKN